MLTAGSETATTTVQGTTPSWLTVRGRTVAEGRFLDNQDVKDHTAVGGAGRDHRVGALQPTATRSARPSTSTASR